MVLPSASVCLISQRTPSVPACPVFFLRPQYTLPPLALELLLLKGRPLLELREEDTYWSRVLTTGLQNRREACSLGFKTLRRERSKEKAVLVHTKLTLFPHSITPKISPIPEQCALAQKGTAINRSGVPNSPTSEQPPSPKPVGR